VFLRMLEHVFLHLYHHRAVKNPNEDKRDKDQDGAGGGQGSGKIKQFCLETSLLPTCENIHYIPDYPAFIDISQILFINSQLPPQHQSKWRFLFSSQIHGESFSTFIGRIMDQGSTVIIVEDTNGYIFGGFATDSWSLSPNFVGDENSFLFTLRPRMRSFPTTTYNDHYQYLNLHQQTMPNGMIIFFQTKKHTKIDKIK
jgi:TLD